MTKLLDAPLLLFILSMLFLETSVQTGAELRKVRPLKEEERGYFGVVLTATLTLLGLLIGFSFSMSVSRYELRKNYEMAEANAIGTEYVRADLLSANDAARVRELLKKYADQRVLLYRTSDQALRTTIIRDTAGLQKELWTAIVPAVRAQPAPVATVVISGMTDVLNSQRSSQAAWWNRIPVAAWVLMAIIAVMCNVMVGYGAPMRNWRLFLITPLTASIAFLLIADIDSPRGGAIRVAPQNLSSLAQSLQQW
jgi:hypothetical protein